MTPRNQIIKRIALGLVLLVAVGFIASFINNALAQRAPETQLPTMEVYYNEDTGDRLPVDYIRRDAYTWRFMFWTHSGGGKDLEIWRSIRPAPVPSGSELKLVFSTPPAEVDIGVLVLNRENTFTPLGGSLHAPTLLNEPHVYKVEARWADDRQVTYYFVLEAPW